MKMQIVGRNVEMNEALRAHVERRLSFALGRFGDRVGRVMVRFSDINGHRGGVDKRCQIDVDLLLVRGVRAEDTDADLFIAVDRAADRAARSIARAMERDRRLAAPRQSRGAAPNRRHWPEGACSTEREIES
jgi:ribosomal subunit interface protein